MESPENQFKKLTLRLISDGHFKNKGEVANAIGEKSLTDILSGTKRIRFDHIQGLKDRIPSLNTNWVFTGEGSIYSTDNSSNVVSEPQSTYVPGQGDISSLLEDISSRMDPEGQKLVSHLKVEIDELISQRDAAVAESLKDKEKIITVIEKLEKIGK